MDDENLRSPQSNNLIRSWQHASEAKALESNYAWWDIALGAALFFGPLGASLGLVPTFIGDADLGSAILMSMIGVAIGAIAGVLVGLLVWIIGRWLAALLRIEQFLRSHVAERLDEGRGRVLYAGAVGTLGGVVLQLFFLFGDLSPTAFEGVGGTVARSLLFWPLASMAGALVNLLFTRRKRNNAP